MQYRGESLAEAQFLCERLGSLLRESVWVTDGQGALIAGALPEQAGEPADGERSLRLPVKLGDQIGEVHIAHLADDPRVAEHLTGILIEQVLEQMKTTTGLPDRAELRSQLLLDLFRQTAPEEDLRRRSHILGLDLKRPQFLLLVEARSFILGAPLLQNLESGETRSRRRSQMLIDRTINFFHAPVDLICAHLGDGEIAILKGVRAKRAAAAPDGALSEEAIEQERDAFKQEAVTLLHFLRDDARSTDITMAMGRYYPGLAGLARSYDEAKMALRVGMTFSGLNQLHAIDDLRLAMFVGLADDQIKHELALKILAPLLRRDELILTLRTFFQHDASPSQAAEALGIHRNTLLQRLQRIEAETGLSPSRFDDAVQLRLALLWVPGKHDGL